MRSRLVIIALTMLLSAPFPSGTAMAQSAALKAAPSDGVLDVSTLMREAKQLEGSIRVEGVVSQVFPKEQKLGLIDAAEFKRCGVVTCADLVLPVRWSGTMPEPKTHVRLEGEIQKLGVRMEFAAKSLEKVSSK